MIRVASSPAHLQSRGILEHRFLHQNATHTQKLSVRLPADYSAGALQTSLLILKRLLCL
jgi:hypothetical protein